jgi:hypothetical protein
MAKADGIAADMVRASVARHDDFWAPQRKTMQAYRDLYGSRFHGADETPDGNVLIETGDGPAHVESVVGALFSRAPAVEVGQDLSDEKHDPRVPQTVSNMWLGKQRSVFEQGTRLALLYPCAFFRVGPVSGKRARRPVDAVEVQARAPWNILADLVAPDWAHMRFVGDRYQLPLAQAKLRFPGQKFTPCQVPNFFEAPRPGRRSRDDENLPEALQYVTIVEFYDLVREELVFWSPDKDGGESPISRSPMPLHVPGTRDPIHPIVPLYFAYDPDQPVCGISPLSRTYDQFREKNLIRSQAADCLRRDSRLWECLEDAFEPAELDKLRAGKDGTILITKKPLGTSIGAIPVPAMSSNFAEHSRNVDADLRSGSVMAPFTRGEPAGGRTSSREIGVLAEYTASSMGQRARERDGAIEQVDRLYLAHLCLASGEVTRVQLDGKIQSVTAADLDREWVITALDQAGTPMSRALEQQRFLQVLPLIQTLGIPPNLLVDQLVRLEILPPEFKDAIPPPPAAAPAPAPEVAQEGQTMSDEELLALHAGA